MKGHHGPQMPMVPPEGVDQLTFDVFRALMSTMKLNGRGMMRSLAVQGGHPGQAGCLWAIGAHEGVSQRELSEMVHLAPPTVTAMLQRMERSGLIERWQDEDDQRVTRIRLTDAGSALNRDLRAAHGRYLADTIGRMPKSDRTELVRLLEVLSANISAALEKPEA
jgi:DNA-binding MarR family transcriptional regulator